MPVMNNFVSVDSAATTIVRCGLAEERVVIITPMVTHATERLCDMVYLFPAMSHPMHILTTSPPLRKIIWTGIGMLYANAALLATLMK